MSLLGIDLGTSGIKCVAYNKDGRVIKKVYREYTLFAPDIGIAELDPELVWNNLKDNLIELNAFHEIKKDPISALSISVSGDEALPIDKNGKVLYNTIMSMDKRGLSENKILNKIEVYDLIMDSAKESNFPVLFLPYFEGAQTPWKNPNATGTILGLTLRTKKEDIIRGMMEGITFDLKLNLEKIQESGIQIDAIRATGGGARSDTWLQFKADITGKVIQKLDIDEAGCMAAAVLAGYGSGIFDSVSKTINKWVKIKKEFKPDMKKYRSYEPVFLNFIKAYKSVKNIKVSKISNIY